MTTYKLFRVKKDKLYPLYVEATREMVIGPWLKAGTGEKIGDGHVKARKLSRLAYRPGFHSTLVPFTDWIGKRGPDGQLMQAPDTVWCECEVEGNQLEVTDRGGLKEVPQGWYYFKTNSKQKDPWVISGEIKINRVLTRDEVVSLCEAAGLKAQSMAV